MVYYILNLRQECKAPRIHVNACTGCL